NTWISGMARQLRRGYYLLQSRFEPSRDGRLVRSCSLTWAGMAGGLRPAAGRPLVGGDFGVPIGREHVANAADGVHQRDLPAVVDLSAQVADIDVDDVA